MKGTARRGFNAILACDSIKSAESYYRVLREMIGQRERCDLKVATIFSFAPNAPEDPCGFIDDEELECDGMPQADRDFLDGAIANYNAMFSTSFSTDSQGFDGYYKDVSRRMKGEDVDGKPLPQGECLDLLIVVDMFLTGFDAKTLNTLWVDKNLRMHGLIQAFSRTNRILNSVKTFGNVVCFRNLEENVDEAIGLFGDPKAGGIVLLKPYDVYFEEYAKKLAHLREAFSFDALDEPMGEDGASATSSRRFRRSCACATSSRASRLRGRRHDRRLGAPRITRACTSTCAIICASRASGEGVDRRRPGLRDGARSATEINIDYILMLVEKRHGDNVRDREIAERIRSSVAASPELRDKQDLIDRFLEMAGFCEMPATFSIDPEASEERDTRSSPRTGASSCASPWRRSSEASSKASASSPRKRVR